MDEKLDKLMRMVRKEQNTNAMMYRIVCIAAAAFLLLNIFQIGFTLSGNGKSAKAQKAAESLQTTVEEQATEITSLQTTLKKMQDDITALKSTTTSSTGSTTSSSSDSSSSGSSSSDSSSSDSSSSEDESEY